MFKIKTKIANVHSLYTQVKNVHPFKMSIDNAHKFAITLYGATINCFAEIISKSKYSSYIGDLLLKARVKIEDNSTCNSDVKMTTVANFSVNELYKSESFVELSLQYTIPLTWNNLITRYDTWENVMNRFATWEEVKTYK